MRPRQSNNPVNGTPKMSGNHLAKPYDKCMEMLAGFIGSKETYFEGDKFFFISQDQIWSDGNIPFVDLFPEKLK